jgi:Zn-dependent protease
LGYDGATAALLSGLAATRLGAEERDDIRPLHWSWFLVAFIEINLRAKSYSSISWNVLEYLALFLIVMLHEFGHALACRQVGGTANRIVLWPLGGVAYVNPPQRPGAMLWSIAAGPLVNVAFLVVLSLLAALNQSTGWADTIPNAYEFWWALWKMNLVLLIFNLLPFYPLDGGQILRSLLWFAVGRARSLMVATVVGFIGVLGFIAFALWMRTAWFAILAAYFLMNCWSGLKQGRALLRLAKLPRREGFACPSCHTAPPLGAYWKCSHCGQLFDTFQTQAACPKCAAHFAVTRCLDCGTPHPMTQWVIPARLATI